MLNKADVEVIRLHFPFISKRLLGCVGSLGVGESTNKTGGLGVNEIYPALTTGALIAGLCSRFGLRTMTKSVINQSAVLGFPTTLVQGLPFCRLRSTSLKLRLCSITLPFLMPLVWNVEWNQYGYSSRAFSYISTHFSWRYSTTQSFYQAGQQ